MKTKERQENSIETRSVLLEKETKQKLEDQNKQNKVLGVILPKCGQST
jgi:hypothetical protein